ncbi:MAG: KUP/HAK/KT family potassium transporter, partial [Mucilaginibacter polytrichastri]|nr:KUP/HAK/KT family potassium transporter [Mucilaginibacter polytrichastri]
MINKDGSFLQRLSFAGWLVAIGIVYGDIGTSPLYTMRPIIGQRILDESLILGSVSCIFWTLFFQTTIKYVIITLRADNHGEGGIFALYALIRRYRKWLIIPAIAGGAFLLADSIMTPPISVTSAIEGLQQRTPGLRVEPIVLVIIVFLFFIQRFGTKAIGRLFGPVMLCWFLMIAIVGGCSLVNHPEVLRAFNPFYAWKFVTTYPEGFWLLGAVFLCTTGAEALYSDLGHVGRKNIRASWAFVKVCLLLSYFGQAALLMDHVGKRIGNGNPFFDMMPAWFLLPGIVIATMAAVIASQALISGTFTLLSEAMRLNLWPRMRILFPTDIRGQLYIPAANTALLICCCGVVLFFRESKNMEAAYGLSITMTMLMTTVLLGFYLLVKRTPVVLVVLLLVVFLTIEGSFLIANLRKFLHGGWVTLILGLMLFLIMFIWNKARLIILKYTKLEDVGPRLELLDKMSEDKEIPKSATHLVYITDSDDEDKIEENIFYSLYKRNPKRADLYWFIHVDTMDEPYHMGYHVKELLDDKVIRIDFRLGFRVTPRINYFFRHVVQELVESKEVDITSRYSSLKERQITGDFKFVILERFVSFENELNVYENAIMKTYFVLHELSLG